MGTASRSAAAPPHTATILPTAVPAPAVAAMSFSTAGCSVGAPASCECPRSMARVYCVKSLLPIDRKSTSEQPRCRQRRGGSLDHCAQLNVRGDREFGGKLLDYAAHGDISAASVTIGMRSRTWPASWTRRAARSWVRSRSGAPAVRTPREPGRRTDPGRGQRQIAKRLVAAHVHQPQDQRFVAECRGDALVGRELFSLRRRRVPIEE